MRAVLSFELSTPSSVYLLLKLCFTGPTRLPCVWPPFQSHQWQSGKRQAWLGEIEHCGEKLKLSCLQRGVLLARTFRKGNVMFSYYLTTVWQMAWDTIQLPKKKKSSCGQSELSVERRWNQQLWIIYSRGVPTLACYAAFPWALLTLANWNAEHLGGPAEICTASQDPSSICVQLQSLDSYRRQHEIILIKRNEHMADNNSLRDIFDSLAWALVGPPEKRKKNHN